MKLRENKQISNKNIKEIKRDKEEKEVISFDKNLIDVIATVNDAILPNFGVEIIGANLKINIPESHSNENIHSNENSPQANKGITTTKDDETGLVRTKALPYTFNPKLSITTTRKDYLENGIVGKTNNVLKNFLKTKVKNKHNLSQKASKERLEHHKSNSRINTERVENDFHFTSQQTPVQTTSIEETIDLLKSSRIQKPFAFLPSIRMSSHQARKLLFEQNELKQYNQSLLNYKPKEVSNDSTKRRLNMSMVISSKTKLTSQIPNSRETWLTKSKILDSQGNPRDAKESLRDSVTSSKSDATDRLVDYKNDKNLRRK